MMKIFIAISFILFSVSFCNGQNNFFLKVKVNDLPYSKIYLASIYGHQQRIIDSATINQEGYFQFQLPHSLPPLQLERGLRGEVGMYRIILGQTPKAIFKNEAAQSFTIIFKNENTELTTNFNSPLDSMQVSVGTENKMYYQYLKEKKQYNEKLDLLEQMLRYYPSTDNSTDNFYSQIQKQYNDLQNELTKYYIHLIQKYPNAYFTKVVLEGQYPFLDASLTEEMRLKELKNNYFQPSDFQDTMLLYSTIISDKIFAYINLYRNSKYTEPEQSDEFIQAANKLLTIAKTGHPKVYKYTLNYLIEGFNEIKQNAVLAYISDNFMVTNSCGIEDEKLKQILQKTADYKRTATGAIAPEIIFHTTSLPMTNEPMTDKPVKLSDIHSDYILIIFWASWCSHCTQVLPEIKKVVDEFNQKQKTSISNLTSQYSNLTIVAVSIDKEEKPWKDFIEKNELSGFINLCEFKGWEGEIGKSYNVNATPTMFLLDKQKKIIAKPENAEQLINNLPD